MNRHRRPRNSIVDIVLDVVLFLIVMASVVAIGVMLFIFAGKVLF